MLIGLPNYENHIRSLVACQDLKAAAGMRLPVGKE